MKRITWWPQAWLGIVFSWAALVGWSEVTGSLTRWPGLLLYAGSIFWVIGYDTIYALQDVEDDALVGVRSSARALGARVRPGVAIFYALALALWGAAFWHLRPDPLVLAALAPRRDPFRLASRDARPADGANALASLPLEPIRRACWFSSLAWSSAKPVFDLRGSGYLSPPDADPRHGARPRPRYRFPRPRRRRRRRRRRAGRIRQRRCVGAARRARGCRAVGRGGTRPARVRRAAIGVGVDQRPVERRAWTYWSSARSRWRARRPRTNGPGSRPRTGCSRAMSPISTCTMATNPRPPSLKEAALAAEDAARAVAGVTNSEGGGASAHRTTWALATSHGFAGAYHDHQPRHPGERARGRRRRGDGARLRLSFRAPPRATSTRPTRSAARPASARSRASTRSSPPAARCR